MKDLKLTGVIPANLMAFTPDLEIDEEGLRQHLEWILGNPIGGLTCNGHAAEVSALNREERQRSLALTVETVNGRVPVIAGVYADDTRGAVQQAQDAKAGGADALLIFPSPIFAEARKLRREMVLAHYQAIAEATDHPIVLFEYARHTGCHYNPDLLLELVESVPQIVAVKEWSLNINDYEENLRTCRSASRHVSVLSSFSSALLPSLAVGADGVLSGHGALIADWQCELWGAVQRGDLHAAQTINAKIYPVARACYADPFQDGHNRMKYASYLLGRFRHYAVRPPLLPIPQEEREAIARALTEAGLLKAGVL